MRADGGSVKNREDKEKDHERKSKSNAGYVREPYNKQEGSRLHRVIISGEMKGSDG